MKIGIICAMQEELDAITKLLNVTCSIDSDRGFSSYTANYKCHQLVFILCGIGKVNAAASTQYLVSLVNPEAIINVGVAGSLVPTLKFGDVVVATDLVHHDMNVTAFGIQLGQIPRMEVFSFPSDKTLLSKFNQLQCIDYQVMYGRIVSGDQFIDSSPQVEFLRQEFDALACEMEGAAIAHVCYLNQVPCVVVRAVSDMAGQNDTLASRSFDELKEMSALRAAAVVEHLLKLI